jgi:broad specificity phosphatase PhoE
MVSVPADLLHLVRHGEVYNPDGILYGRLQGFHLSELGHRMAAAAAESLSGHAVTALYASPLQRTQESAEPWSKLFQLPIVTDERLIEPTNRFEGGTAEFGLSLLAKPRTWPLIYNPFRPSWGEAFSAVATRMFSAMDDAWQNAERGEVVLVSHQMPIWMVARAAARKSFVHDPRKRRCTLSSITTFARIEGTASRRGWVEVDYQEPARALLATSIDLGAV